MNTEQLQSLFDRVRKATGADREIDAAIASLLLGKAFKREPNGRTWRMGHKETRTRDAEPWVALPAYTDSIDAALALTERVLPETVRTGFQQNPDKSWHAVILRVEPDEGDCPYAAAPTAPLAILAATLSALIEAGRIK